MSGYRIRISTVMSLVVLAAVDFMLVRVFIDKPSFVGELWVVGALPMLNGLAIGLWFGRRRPRHWPFVAGFEAFGVLALGIYLALATSFPAAMHRSTDVVVIPLVRALAPLGTVVRILGVCLVAGGMLVLPQLAFALAGGLVVRKLRVTIVARCRRSLKWLEQRLEAAGAP